MRLVAGDVSDRVLPEEEVTSLGEYEERGGGRGWRAAADLAADELIARVEAAGLRGRGGGGFPTGKKWRTVSAYGSEEVPATVVVNGAEGEPGTFKDRAIMRRNPHAIVEGALIAARAVGADRIVIAIKETFDHERARLERAIRECADAGWTEGVNLAVATGPTEYLFGEETALLEVMDGRPPFPRIAPPWRQGVDDVGPAPDQPAGAIMAEPGAGPPPTLVNNVETMANVGAIIAEGAEWFRSLGTPESPGTIVCTVTGATRRHGVAEIPMGTALQDAIDLIGGGAVDTDRRFVAAMSGVANPLLTADQFGTALSYEAMRAAGSGLGAGGFMIFDDTSDMAAVAAGVSRFLAVESCGQCTPCKQDGLGIAARLERVCRGEGTEQDLIDVAELLDTVPVGARCFLATQHDVVVRSIVALFPDAFRRHIDGRAQPVEPVLIAPLVDIEGDVGVLDESHRSKQPDWTHDHVDSGKAPVDRLAEGGPEA